MLFNSWKFLVFFPFILCAFYILPGKLRLGWLLLCSYLFYALWNPKYVLILFYVTVISYVTGLLIEKLRERKRVRYSLFILGIVLVLSALFAFKYVNFTVTTLHDIAGVFGVALPIPKYDPILPVGISFYTFMALGYVIDVYRGTISAEHHFFDYMLFISFFPQLLSGPIGRAKSLLPQLRSLSDARLSYDRFRSSLLIMLWGYFMKIVIADRIAIFVNSVYADPSTYSGWFIVAAALLYPIEIYCDFAGYSTTALGAAQMLNVDLIDNFRAPFLSTSLTELWRGWHISLTSWFRDYIYIPLGGNRKGFLRKCLNIIIVFTVSGLWHGAAWTYVVWGLLNGLYQCIEMILGIGKRQLSKLGVIINGIWTYLVFTLFVMVFRADSLKSFGHTFTSMLRLQSPTVLLSNAVLECGLNLPNIILLFIAIAALFFVDLGHKKGIVVSDKILKSRFYVRWIVFAGSILFILLFGIWGPAYDSSNFIYFDF